MIGVLTPPQIHPADGPAKLAVILSDKKGGSPLPGQADRSNFMNVTLEF